MYIQEKSVEARVVQKRLKACSDPVKPRLPGESLGTGIWTSGSRARRLLGIEVVGGPSVR
jgi:hypothetical protein